MRQKRPACPNCDTVLVLRYEPDDQATAYECPICGHRVVPDSVGSGEVETALRRPYAR